MVVPAGTQLTVRLSQAVGSKISQPGQHFSANLIRPLQVGGAVAIPAGAMPPEPWWMRNRSATLPAARACNCN